jgi:hypothetical protein
LSDNTFGLHQCQHASGDVPDVIGMAHANAKGSADIGISQAIIRRVA